MLLMSKAISQLLLPPGGLILLGLAGVLFWKRWWGRGAVLLSFLLLWGFSTEPVRDALTTPLEFQYSVLKIDQIKTTGTAIVLLGGGIYENAPEYNGRDMLGRHSMMRTIYAADVARKSGLDLYATGGNPLTHADEAEADLMRHWLLKQGLKVGSLHAETASNNTWENAAFIKNMLAAKEVKRVVLVTSALHMPRAVWCFKSHGFEVVPAPMDYISKQEAYDLRSYLPHWAVLSDSGQALHEQLGLLWYRLRYG